MPDLVAAATRELATLIPRLDAALLRDHTGEHSKGHTDVVPFNPDVLAAIELVRRDIPAVTEHACWVVQERWTPRDVPRCLLALPRLASRMHTMALAAELDSLRGDARRWLVEVKLALGLRTRDVPVGAVCPACGDGWLFAAGQEAFLRGARVEWVSAGRIFCTACTAVWGIAEWPHLGRVLAAAT